MNRRTTIYLLLFFILGWLASSIFSTSSNDREIYPVRENSVKSRYTNPLIFIDNSNTEYEKLNPLKEKVEEYIDTTVSNRKAERTSFYFRDLDSSQWTGVNPDDRFVPASILKVATLMVYLRKVEENPEITNQKLLYKKNQMEKQLYPPSAELEEGYYGVGRLLGQAVVESDNAAALALYKNVSGEYSELYKTLRLPPQPVDPANFMSPREVSRIFRALYGSTYLLNTYSEQALELLTRTNFDKGITNGLDPNIEVAHKFGEYAVYYPDDIDSPDYQLHDCGIVYYPERPYFICVMTEGKNLKNLEEVISTISQITHTFVNEGDYITIR